MGSSFDRPGPARDKESKRVPVPVLGNERKYFRESVLLLWLVNTFILHQQVRIAVIIIAAECDLQTIVKQLVVVENFTGIRHIREPLVVRTCLDNRYSLLPVGSQHIF